MESSLEYCQFDTSLQKQKDWYKYLPLMKSEN